MILNNYFQYKAAIADKYYTVGENKTVTTSAKALDGTTLSINVGSAGAAYPFGSNFSDRVNLEARLGTGDTAPLEDGYALNTDVTSSFNVSLSQSLSFDNGKFKTVILITALNSTSSDITLKELGICKAFTTQGTAPPAAADPRCLFVHQILDEPVTVEAYGSKTLSFEWEES